MLSWHVSSAATCLLDNMPNCFPPLLCEIPVGGNRSLTVDLSCISCRVIKGGAEDQAKGVSEQGETICERTVVHMVASALAPRSILPSLCMLSAGRGEDTSHTP